MECELARKEFNSKIKPAFRKTHEPVCARCGRYGSWGEGTMQIHHKKALIDGGTNDDSNLIVLCGPCHYEYHEFDLPIDEWIKTPPGSLITFLYMMDKEKAKWAIDNWEYCKEYISQSSYLRYALAERKTNSHDSRR